MNFIFYEFAKCSKKRKKLFKIMDMMIGVQKLGNGSPCFSQTFFNLFCKCYT